VSTPQKDPRFPSSIKRLYLLQSQAINDALKAHGLARSQWQALSHVRAAGTLTQKELQKLLRVEPATLTRIVDTLVAKGWLERLENPEDKRKKDLILTESGQERWAKIPNVVEIVEGRMVEGLSASDETRMLNLVEHMIGNLEKRPVGV
jgi:DNA-binding MarR family transcriptional regulator